jgi:drug/metabolite transporter (DMT)-like permease
MLYILGILVAIQLVIGQTLWKVGAERAHFKVTPDYLLSHRAVEFLFSPLVLLGFAIYAIATLLYLGMLAKYEYSLVQGLVVPLSLLMAFGIGRFFFHDKLSIINIIGLLILILGIILATRR